MRRFSTNYGGFQQRFRDAALEADPDAPRREAHTLKGVAATLGAARLEAVARALESACKEGDDGIQLGNRCLRQGRGQA